MSVFYFIGKQNYQFLYHHLNCVPSNDSNVLVLRKWNMDKGER